MSFILLNNKIRLTPHMMNCKLGKSINLINSQFITPFVAISSRNDSGGIIHEGNSGPFISQRPQRPNETIELKRARLLYQSRKRGMLENGLILSTFAKKYLNTFNDDQLKLYDHLINLPSNDWDIFYWAIGMKETPNAFNNEIMDLLKEHVKNNDRQSRLVQPDF